MAIVDKYADNEGNKRIIIDISEKNLKTIKSLLKNNLKQVEDWHCNVDDSRYKSDKKIYQKLSKAIVEIGGIT